ncbi:MAG TPA: class D sortase [Syntrophomonadaceae bacterium]|nr:class D sortase [Syntrophomonadaceae bacterium]
MNKVKFSRGRRLLVTVLSLGFIVLGIGCISWAVFSMWTASVYSADTTRSFPTGYTTEGVNVESDSLLVLPATDKTLYPVYPAAGDKIGSLTVQALKRELPVFQGTGVEELKKGVGHFSQSVLPGEKDNCVFSGHRETVFRHIGDLKIGDQLIVQTSAGTFTYAVSGTRIVHADDKTVIVPTDHAVLTMTTCYPFNTPGYFPDRYIVSANLVKSK